MAFDQESVSELFSILSHELRREIILIINEKNEQSFTDIMNTLELNTGILSFHMRKLNLFLEQTPTGKYRLNRLGNKILGLIKDFEYLSVETDIIKKKTELPIASFAKRAVAYAIDATVAFTITMAATLVTNLSTLFSGNYILEINVILFITLFWLYSTLMEGFAGQTMGKVFLGIRVVTISGKKLSYDYAAVRNFGKCFLLPIDLVIGLRLKDKRFIRYFDKYSGTAVISLKS